MRAGSSSGRWFNEPSHLPSRRSRALPLGRQIDPRAYLIVNDLRRAQRRRGRAFFKFLAAARRMRSLRTHRHFRPTSRGHAIPLDRVSEILRPVTLRWARTAHYRVSRPARPESRSLATAARARGTRPRRPIMRLKVLSRVLRPSFPAGDHLVGPVRSGFLATGGGLLRADLSPKPVYQQLMRLIHEEWTTGSRQRPTPAAVFPSRLPGQLSTGDRNATRHHRAGNPTPESRAGRKPWFRCQLTGH